MKYLRTETKDRSKLKHGDEDMFKMLLYFLRLIPIILADASPLIYYAGHHC